MKKLLLITGILMVSVALMAQNPRSQQRGQEKKEQAQEKAEEQKQQGQDRGQQGQERGQQAREQAQQQRERGQAGQEADKADPRGHAYGRDKGGMHGRDFGQARAAAARSKEEKQEIVREVAVEVEEGVRRTTTRVEEARETIEERRRRGEISEEEYEKRTRRVEEIEKEIEQIEAERRGTERVIRERIP